jgi:ComF family protein
MWQDFIHLFYPQVCRACGNSLFKGEEVLCTFCFYHLPRTDFSRWAGNPAEKRFWGKVPIEHAAAFLYFNKGQRVQHLIHQLKYNGVTEIGTYLGNLFGNELKESVFFKDIDAVIPVPLHPSRLQSRGYNQSLYPAREIARCLNCRLDEHLLVRTVKTTTQTQKQRYERWQNVESAFGLHRSHPVPYRHVLLVDDVITTGSTLAACAEVLITQAHVKVSLAALAIA